MQNAIVNVNGEISTFEKAKVSVFDRGYLYGDSIYEVARSYSGKLFLLDQHLDRLGQSARLCQMQLNQTLAELESQVSRTFDVFRTQPGYQNTEVYARLIVTRGVGKIGFGLHCINSPTQFTVIIQPVDAPTPSQYQTGMKLQISNRLRNDRRAIDPAMKSGNYLNSLLAYLDASASNFDDALLCNAEDHITEGTTFNFFYVRRGIVATPPLGIGILAGITRKHVINLAKDLNYEVREVRFDRLRIYDADEAFISSSIKEVFPVVQIDQQTIGTGRPGEVTRRIHEMYRASIARW